MQTLNSMIYHVPSSHVVQTDKTAMSDLSKSMQNLVLQLLTTYLYYHIAYGYQTWQTTKVVTFHEGFPQPPYQNAYDHQTW